MKHLASALSVSLVAAGAASGQIVVDGTVDANYGAALSIQNTNTEFGNATNGDPREAFSGSEIDAVYGVVDGGFLNLMIAGNLENNFNKLEIFIDSEAGGQNSIDGQNLPAAVDAFCCGGFGTVDGALQRMDGLTFDTGFEADYFLTVSNGTESVGVPGFGVTGWIATAHWAELNNGAGGLVAPLGGQLNAGGLEPGLAQGELVDQNNNDPIGTPLHEFFEPWDALADPTNELNHRDMENTIGLLMGVNNSNTVGVSGDGPYETPTTEDPSAVTTGFEFAIPLAAIGNPTGDIKVTAFINGGTHDYVANQFSGVGNLSGNLGGDGAAGYTGDLSGVDLNNISGDQFVTISQGGLAGDLDGDGFVGLSDLDIILNNWNQTVPPGNPLADPTGDNFVGLADLDIVLNNWNAGTPPVAAVPEPATLALIGLGGLAALRRR